MIKLHSGNCKILLNTVLLGYLILNFALILSVILPCYIDETYANFLVLMLILLAGILSSRVSLNNLSLITILVSCVLYVFNQGALSFPVPLLPFIGLFFLIKPCDQYSCHRIAILICSASIIIINVFSHYAVKKLSSNYINLQSQIYLYIFLINLVYFRRPFLVPIFLAVANSLLFNPSPIGNRSSIFILLFATNRHYIKNLKILMIKNKFYFFLFLFALAIFIYICINHIAVSPKWDESYNEVRLEFVISIFDYLHTNGLEVFWENAGEILPTKNPHNSFLYLIMYEAYVGIFKILIFMLSILFIPCSAFLAILGRASLDSFFLVGPLGLIFFTLIRSYCKYGI